MNKTSINAPARFWPVQIEIEKRKQKKDQIVYLCVCRRLQKIYFYIVLDGSTHQKCENRLKQLILAINEDSSRLKFGEYQITIMWLKMLFYPLNFLC